MLRCAADGILYQGDKIILIKRAGRTFHNYWALPGGLLDEGEMIEETLVREMKEELNVVVKPVTILGVYSDPGRDPRWHILSTVFICEFKGEPKAGDDAGDFGFFTVDEALQLNLAFDHKIILQDFKRWLGNQNATFWSKKER